MIFSKPTLRRELAEAERQLENPKLSNQCKADITQLIGLLGWITTATHDIVSIATTEDDL